MKVFTAGHTKAIVFIPAALFCFVHGSACIGYIGEPLDADNNQPADGVGSDSVGDVAFGVTSPDKLWKAYRVKLEPTDLEENWYGIFVEGPNGFKKKLAEGITIWPESFSPDSKNFVYVHGVELKPGRYGTSLFQYRMDSDEIEPLTNSGAQFLNMSDEEYHLQEIGEPLNGLKWNGQTFTYETRNPQGFEQITVNIDTNELVRTPLLNYNPDSQG